MDTRQQPVNRTRLAFLDGIRALAALYVALHHIYLSSYPGYPSNTGPWFLGWLLYGQFGVAIFIVVSGFSLSLAPARHSFDFSGGFGHYIGRRAWRIIPPYWAALFLSFAVMALVVARKIPDPVDLKGLLTHLFLVQDVFDGKTPNGAFWSIAIEWQLYFLFPLFLLFRRRIGAAATAVLAFAVVAGVEVAATHEAFLSRLLHLSPQFAALFVFGMVAAGATVAKPERRRVPWGWLAIGLSAGFAAWALLAGTDAVIDNFYWTDIVVGLVTAFVLAAFVGTGARAARRTVEHRAVVGVGRFSYSLYLIHAPILLVISLWVVEPLDLSPNATFGLLLALVVPTALLSAYGFFRLFERPFLERRTFRALVAPWRRRGRDEQAAALDEAPEPDAAVGDGVDPELALETDLTEPFVLDGDPAEPPASPAPPRDRPVTEPLAPR
jgi:peptidoglycan/LPS O-acetylase OafA/YrhL